MSSVRYDNIVLNYIISKIWELEHKRLNDHTGYKWYSSQPNIFVTEKK